MRCGQAFGLQEALPGIHRRSVGQQVVEGAAKGIDIRTGVSVQSVTAVLLEGGIQGCASPLDDGYGHFVRDESLDKTKIHQLEHIGGCNLQVGRLDIAMDKGWVLLVQVGQGICQLVGPGKHLLFTQESAILLCLQHQSTQVLSRDVIHHQVVARSDSKEIRDFGEVGVVEACQDGGFTPELLAGLLEQIGWDCPIVFHFLECTFAPFQAQVVSQVDVSHASLADSLADAVATVQNLVGLERGGHLIPLGDLAVAWISASVAHSEFSFPGMIILAFRFCCIINRKIMVGNMEEAPLLIAQAGPLNGQRWTLNKSLLIGREGTCDVVIPDRMVSRFHARLTPSIQGVALEDLGSKNGTHCNGKPVETKLFLQEGDLVQIAVAQQFIFLTSDATMPLVVAETSSGRLHLDLRSRQTWIDEVLVDPPLSALQFHVLQVLLERQGQVVPREELVSASWGDEQAIGVSDQALDALIRRLRDRLSVIDPGHAYIVTVRGHGIMLDNPK